MTPNTPRFIRVRPGRPSRAQRDDVGRIEVTVCLKGARGNVVRSLTVAGARVSEVHQAIERALFGTTNREG